MGYVANPPVLRIVYAPYSIDLVINTESYTERVEVQSYSISYTSTNASILDNGLRDVSLHAKFQWNLIDTRLSATQWETLQRIYSLWTSDQTAMTLSDFVRPIAEKSPRTRPLAAGTMEADDGTTSIYYPVFNVGFSQPVAMRDTASGNVVFASFQLSELDKLEA